MKLDGRLIAVAELVPADREEMFALMDRYYEQVCRDAFEADLDEKRWVIQIRAEGASALCGFSTQMILSAVVDDRPVKALFSGDTIIDRRFWGHQSLTSVWGNFALSLIDEFAGQELYWFLISGGYKTYRFLPVFFCDYYPRYDVSTPPDAQDVVDAIARHKFPLLYDRASGVVRAQANQYRLRDGVADVTPARRRDPHVEFFVARNPGYVRGDELCCLAPLTRENFTPAAYRVMGVTKAHK
jgi:hypothetical protein